MTRGEDITKTYACPRLVLLIVLLNLLSYQQGWCAGVTVSAEADHYIQRGMKDLDEENYEEAIMSFRKAREADPRSSLAAYLLGITYKLIQDYRSALPHLEDAVNLSPAVREAFFELAEVYYYLERFEDSIKMIDSAEAANGVTHKTAFLRGLALMRLGRYTEAVESFTKAKELNPKLTQSADFHIAMALMKEGRTEEAEKALNEVVLADPNTDLAAVASRHIEVLKSGTKAQKALRLNAGLSFQYDDNVILKPSDQTAAAGITGEHDTKYVATFSAEYRTVPQKHLRIRARYSFYMSDHTNLGSHDVMSHTVMLAPSYLMERGLLSLIAADNYTLVDDVEYLDTFTLSPNYTFVLKRNQTVRASLAFQKKEFLRAPLHADEDRDSMNYSLGIAYTRFFAGRKGLLGAVYRFNEEDTDGVNWDNRSNSLQINTVIPIIENFSASASAEILHQHYKNVNTNFLKRRRDITYTFSVVLGYTLNDRLKLELRYSHIRDDSNIAVYDYRRNITGLWLLAGY